MRSDAETVEEYIESIDPKWKELLIEVRKVIMENLPEGFEETMNNNMIGYVVFHSIYPDGYHVDPNQPLPFIDLAAQKNNISLYHFGIYRNEEMTEWFKSRYKEEVGKKPDMGRSCIRFRNEKDIPFRLLEDLLKKITVEDYIRSYRQFLDETKKG